MERFCTVECLDAKRTFWILCRLLPILARFHGVFLPAYHLCFVEAFFVENIPPSFVEVIVESISILTNLNWNQEAF